jgi:hypothetical protein
MFTENGGRFFFVELRTSLEERLKRNETPHRIEKKPSKRDVDWSREDLLSDAANHRLNSDEGEIWFENHLKIDNTDLSPEAATDIVIKTFGLTADEKDEKAYRFGV